MARQLAALGEEADKLRKEIVATKEGGAITGEAKMREHPTTVYGAITSWEGRPDRVSARAHRMPQA